jgi:hypothetical protein
MTEEKGTLDMHGLWARESARADGVSPAPVADGCALEVDLRTQRILSNLLHHHRNVDTSV